MKRQPSMKTICRRWQFAILSVIVLLNFSMTHYAQGFGAFKKDSYLYRKRPPKIFIQSANVSVRFASGGAPSALDYESDLRDAIEAILKNNGGARVGRLMFDTGSLMNRYNQRFVINDQNPEAIIYSSITRFDSSSSWKKKTEYETKKVGEKEEWDEKKQKMKKKDVYDRVAVESQINVLAASMTVKIDVRDGKSNGLIGSQTLASHYSKEFKEGKGAPQKKDLAITLLKALEDDIVVCLFPTGEAVKVLLPKGKYEDTSEMIEKGQLEVARKSLDALPMMKTPQDEAYRVYSFGALSEIRAYQTVDEREAKQHLQAAARAYAKALEMKSDEKYFQSAKSQAEESIQLYAMLETQAQTYQSASAIHTKPNDNLTVSSLPSNKVAPEPEPQAIARVVSREPQPATNKVSKEPVVKSLGAPSEKQTDAPSPAPSTLSNEVIIKLVKAGLSEENIIATIQESRSNNFDLSPDGLVKMLQAGVTNRIISALHQAKKSK